MNQLDHIENNLVSKLKFRQLSSDGTPDIDDLQLIDIIPAEHLSSLQEQFSIANGVSSAILDLNGKPVIPKSNYGTDTTGSSCKTSEAQAPLCIEGKHIADWKIEMHGFGGIIAPFVKAACGSMEQYAETCAKMSDEIAVRFNFIHNQLKTAVSELSKIGDDNLRLAREMINCKTNEALLSEREGSFRSIFDNSVDGIVLVGQDGIVKEWSHGYEKLSGITKEEAVGRNITEISHSMLSLYRYSKEEMFEIRSRLNKLIIHPEQTMEVWQTIHQKSRQERIIQTLYFPVTLPDSVMLGAISRDITGDVYNKRELVYERKRLQYLSDNLPGGSLYRFVHNLVTNKMFIEYASAKWEAVTGIAPDALTESMDAFFDIIQPDDKQEFLEGITESGNNMTNFEMEIRVNDKGAVRWLQFFSHPHTKTNNVIWDGIVLDITNRKEAEIELRVERERLNYLGDNLPEGCLFRFVHNIVNDNVYMEYISGKWETVTGVTSEATIENIESFHDVMFPEDKQVLLEAIVVSEKNMTDFDQEVRITKNGNTRWLHIISHPHFENDTMCWDGVLMDITSRKEAELELLNEKERIQSLSDNLPNGSLFRLNFHTLTGKMNVTYLGGSWYELTGIPVEAVFADANAMFGKILPESLPAFLQDVQMSLTTLSRFNSEVPYMGRNNETCWLQISSQPRLDGEQVICDGFILDITERKIAELKLDSYRRDLEFAVRERTEEMEAANEELYATNEELYATNEEFAAINEELNLKNDQLQHEMSARKETMQQLEESENKMRSFIMQTFEGIVIINDEGRVIEWNPEQERITQIPRKEALGKYSWDLYRKVIAVENEEEKIETFHKQVVDFLNPANGQKQPEESEQVFHIPGKGKRYIALTAFQIAVGDKYYRGEIVRDNTERKLIDLELEQYRTQLEEMVALQTKELIESKERLTSLSDNLPGGIIYQMSGKQGETPQFTYISARFTDMFNIAIDEVINDNSLFFRLFHPEDGDRLIDQFTSSDQQGFVDTECRLCLDSGETKWMHIRTSCNIQDDESYLWDGFMVDITDRKIAERELEETRRRQNILIKVLNVIQSADNIDDALNTALRELGQYAEVSRSYIFEKTPDGKASSNTYEWCNEGITPEIDNLKYLPNEELRTWYDIFAKGEYICASNINQLAPEVYEILEPQGIKSILVLPLETNGIIFGFVGFDECTRYKEWHKKEVELLISLSQIISTTTTRFRAEKSMQLSQQTMRTVLDNINAAIYVADIDTYEILFANKMIKDQMNGEVEGKICWKTLQAGMTGPCEFCPNPKLLDHNKKPTGLYRWEIQNQALGRWFECSDAAIEWIDGRMVHMEYATDITDRKAAEEAVRRSEELYRQLTVASPDAIVVCNPRGRFIFVSPKAKELFHLDDDININKMRLAHYIHPHDLRKSFDIFRTLVNDNVSFLPQLLLMREDGSDFFGEISAASVKDDQGNTTSIIMVIRDITERKINEIELIRAKEKAEESDKLKSSFLANMSHEIRTPINGIIGFLNFLADDNLSSKRRHEYITIVNNSSTQLVKLIDDIIDVAKIEAKQLSIRPTSVKLNDFMHELQVFFDTYLQANHKDKVAMVLDDSGFIDDCVIFVDPMRLRQVISNLIGNAIKFTEKGYIGFGYRPLPPDKLEFWVEDSGIGLAANQLEVIFERFRQAEITNSRKYGGTGLGLTISRSLVQMMGGEINVESTEGEGSTFRFNILYLPVEPQDELLFDENVTEKPITQPFEGVSVVIVEPEAMAFRYYEKLLAPSGAKLIQATTVKQWMETISQQTKIDIVLANASVFKNEDDEALREVKSVRAGLPLVLVIPERNEYYTRVITECQCNKVIDGMPDYAKLYETLKKYV